MPLTIERYGPADSGGDAAAGASVTPHPVPAGALRIGLVNNMPDAALRATERQFEVLLERAARAAGCDVRLSFHALPEVPRSAAAQAYIAENYSPTPILSARAGQHEDGSAGPAALDAIIVTGAEPVSPHLSAEPYWPALTELIDRAEAYTLSSVWSCLAAHALVLHLDGIERRRRPEKLCGIFAATPAAVDARDDHSLLGGLAAPGAPAIRVPHSRWNDLAADELERHGYRVLTRLDGPGVNLAEDAATPGVDLFTRERRSLFVCFHGHPEYEPSTLAREYRRDAGRYLRGEQAKAPALPAQYFDRTTTEALAAVSAKAATMPAKDEPARAEAAKAMLAELSAILDAAPIEDTWSEGSAVIYANWLRLLAERKVRAASAIKAEPVFGSGIESEPPAAGHPDDARDTL